MAYGRRSGLPRSKAGHSAHTRMGLPRGNPLAQGGNFSKRGGSRRGGLVRVGRRPRRSY